MTGHSDGDGSDGISIHCAITVIMSRIVGTMCDGDLA